MESDINTTSTTTSSTRESMPYTGTDTMAGERGFADYATDFGSSFATGTGRAVTFLADRPLLTGSIAVGAIGAFLGSRLGHTFAMRRRKSFYERAIDYFGPSLAVLSTTFSRKNRERAMGRIADTGKDVLESTQGLRETVMERMPDRIPVEKSRLDKLPLERLPLDKIPVMDRMRREEKPSTIRQIGYGLSLIPVTMALIRNPLVRDIGFRFLARRVRPRRRR